MNVCLQCKLRVEGEITRAGGRLVTCTKFSNMHTNTAIERGWRKCKYFELDPDSPKVASLKVLNGIAPDAELAGPLSPPEGEHSTRTQPEDRSLPPISGKDTVEDLIRKSSQLAVASDTPPEVKADLAILGEMVRLSWERFCDEQKAEFLTAMSTAINRRQAIYAKYQAAKAPQFGKAEPMDGKGLQDAIDKARKQAAQGAVVEAYSGEIPEEEDV